MRLILRVEKPAFSRARLNSRFLGFARNDKNVIGVCNQAVINLG
jgi:hypothetical protein